MRDIKRTKENKSLSKLKPIKYRIYGIFNFKNDKLICVNMSLPEIEFDFDLEGYDTKEYAIVSFEVILR